MTLRIIATGGTFDKSYDPVKGSLSFGQSHLNELLAQARVADPVACEVAMLIDSLDMAPGHRQQILTACQLAPEPIIVIVHGTDTMVATAQVLGQAALNKTIVLTGAMVPATVVRSDALFNLGYAMACAQRLSIGVYVAMGARCLAWDNVRKNRELGVFEPLR
jgi:L-asparaginase